MLTLQLSCQLRELWSPAIQAAEAATEAICELALPFEALGASPQAELAFFVSLWRAGVEIERHPAQGAIRLTAPTDQFELHNWEV